MNIILNAGVSGDLKPFLQDKIKISNQVALLMAGVGLFYTIFSIVFYPPLTIYPLFCIVLSFGAIALNYFGLYNISRFTLSTLVILLAYLYHGFLVQPEEGIITSMFFIEFSLTVIPWVLIDFREKSLLLISLLACHVLLFSQSWANDILSIELDSSLFRGGFLEIASYGFAGLILISCLVFMQMRNYTSEIKNEKLVLDIHNKNGEMEKQRAELENHLNELNTSRQLDEKQNWISQGIANISEILRLEEDGQIYNKLISAIVNYINANQGGDLFIER